VHSNVGGGYEEHGLSDYALVWMAERAAENGLKLLNFANVKLSFTRPFGPDPAEKIQNSQTFLYRLATVLLVKLPATLGLPSVYPLDDQRLAKFVTWSGDYIRPVDANEDFAPVREKAEIDPAYRPKQLATLPGVKKPEEEKVREPA
jgi:hypothetical protein